MADRPWQEILRTRLQQLVSDQDITGLVDVIYRQQEENELLRARPTSACDTLQRERELSQSRFKWIGHLQSALTRITAWPGCECDARNGHTCELCKIRKVANAALEGETSDD